MSRTLRQEARKAKIATAPLPEPMTFSMESIRRALDAEEQCSERRFEKLASVAAVRTINSAITQLLRRRKLTVKVTEKADEVPFLVPDTRFKYSRYQYGTLEEQCDRMKKGEKTAVAWVEEDKIVIGYGIALLRNKETQIDIIDVDLDSRRKHGLSDLITIEGEEFTVGVGHVIVRTLIRHCSAPFRTDATTHSSRYIFKSLGFVREKSKGNPCLLRLDR